MKNALDLFNRRYKKDQKFSWFEMIDFAEAYASQPKETQNEYLVTYRYTNRTDAAIHEDRVFANGFPDACNKVCANHNFEVKWHTVVEIESTPALPDDGNDVFEIGDIITDGLLEAEVIGEPKRTHTVHVIYLHNNVADHIDVDCCFIKTKLNKKR